MSAYSELFKCTVEEAIEQRDASRSSGAGLERFLSSNRQETQKCRLHETSKWKEYFSASSALIGNDVSRSFAPLQQSTRKRSFSVSIMAASVALVA